MKTRKEIKNSFEQLKKGYTDGLAGISDYNAFIEQLIKELEGVHNY